MEFLKKHYVSSILIPMFMLYFITMQIGAQMGGVIVGTVFGNLIIIAGVGFIYWLDHFKQTDGNIITSDELKYNKMDVIISYVLILLLWIFGQFVFLWVYKTFGDITYTKKYADTFSDVSVVMWTLLLTSIVAPIAEELVFRYLLFGQIIYKNNKRPSYVRYILVSVLSAVLFGLLHGTMIHQIIIIPLGFVLGMLMYKTNRIVFPILGHILFNNLSIFLSPLLVLYQQYLTNYLVVGTMVSIYVILVLGTLGFVITKKEN